MIADRILIDDPWGTPEEAAQRVRVLEVARTWISTPYHHHGRIRGVGVDCATLLTEVYREAGVVPAIPLPAYSPQWYLHRDREWYLEIVEQWAGRIEGPPEPGDIAVYQIGRCFAHGAIVVQWPRAVIHAYQASRIVLETGALDGALAMHQNGRRRAQPREVRFYSPWRRPDGVAIQEQRPG